MRISRRLMLTAAAIGMAYAAAASAVAGEKQTIDAFSVWQARGHMFKRGENIGMFVGALHWGRNNHLSRYPQGEP